MNNKVRGKYISSLIFAILFLLFTLEVKFLDVRAIGPNGSKVGFAAINGALASKMGTSNFWYAVSGGLGYTAIIFAALLGGLGLYELITRKKLKSVDRELILLGIFYIIVLSVYILFEILKINYRPVLIHGELEASYPSSHTVLAFSIFGSLAEISNSLPFFEKGKRPLTRNVCTILAVLAVISRFLSGVHWMTDILGAVFLSAALFFLFAGTFEAGNKT